MGHISKFIPKDSRPSKDRELTEKQQVFLDSLLHTGGDPKRAAELAGYAEGSYPQVLRSLQTEVIDLASHILAQSAPQGSGHRSSPAQNRQRLYRLAVALGRQE